jgi:hypothetical protein
VVSSYRRLLELGDGDDGGVRRREDEHREPEHDRCDPCARGDTRHLQCTECHAVTVGTEHRMVWEGGKEGVKALREPWCGTSSTAPALKAWMPWRPANGSLHREEHTSQAK